MMSVGETVAAPATGQAEIPASAGAPSHAAARRTRRGASVAGAVVLGGDYQGLGIVRSLGRHGVPTFVIDDERSISRFSRHCGGRAWIEDLGTGDGFVDELLRLGEWYGLDGWVLYPTRDETVAAIAQERARLQRFFRVATPGWDTIRWASDKRNTYRLAAEAGVPAPRTWHGADRGELEALAVDFPVAIKPAIKENFFYATKAKAWRADDRAELLELFDRASSIVEAGEVMVQELIPGGGGQQFGYCALCSEGRTVASMVVRRLRQHPPEFGRASTFVETVEEPAVEELSERLLRTIAYDGLVELEYKRDPRDGRFKLLDFNARTCGYQSLGQAAGVDFPYLLYRQSVGLPVAPQRARAGTRWVRLLTDLPTAAQEILGGRQSPRAYLRSLRGVRTEAVFSRSDPVPGLVELALLPYLAVRRGL